MTTAPKVRFLDRTTPPHIATLTLMAGTSAMTMSIFLPSLTRMSAYFGADYGVMQLAVSGYLAATALLQIIIGPISDRFGRRPVILGALSIFVLATIGTIYSTNVETFLAFRMLQAVIASGMVLSRAIVRDMVPGDQAASMIGYVTMGMAIIPMAGPVIGGMLDQAFGWEANFIFLLVAGLLVLALCWLDLGETAKGTGISFGQQLRVYPELLSSQRFWGYSLCAAFGSGAFFALLGAASYVSGTIYGLSPRWTGLAIGSPAAGYVLGNYLSGRYSVRYGINKMALAGSIVASAGLGLSLIISLMGYNSALLFFGFCPLLGLGNGLQLPSAMAGSLSVRPQLAGTASGLSGAIMIGGGAALSAMSGALLAGRETAQVLQVIMFLSAVMGIVSILWVMRREKQLNG
ncbi:MAG: multidrug effflux MFS transporter [Rhodobacteraceae bacterium]|nr:multidrug effflux MFS transporter [Paracoccaceae bacterium]